MLFKACLSAYLRGGKPGHEGDRSRTGWQTEAEAWAKSASHEKGSVNDEESGSSGVVVSPLLAPSHMTRIRAS